MPFVSAICSVVADSIASIDRTGQPDSWRSRRRSQGVRSRKAPAKTAAASTARSTPADCRRISPCSPASRATRRGAWRASRCPRGSRTSPTPETAAPASRQARRCPSRPADEVLECWNRCPGQPRLFGQIVQSPLLDGRRVAGRADRRRRGDSARPFFLTASGVGPTTRGITSPARVMITSSPSRMSLVIRSTSLWSVACWTITPETLTGSITACGTSRPVRPTFQSIRNSSVFSSIGGNFQAIAPRGSRPETPARRIRSVSFTFTTAPSIS